METRQVNNRTNESRKKALDRWPIDRGQNSKKLRTLAEE